jgi:predicted nuclease of predicted toxin-antitoxin system
MRISDNQLPAALARWLTAKGHDAVHVLDIG